MVSSTVQSNVAPKVIDLFCGCGGFSLGATRAGFDIVAGVDLDKNAIAAHAINFPASKHLNLDLSKVPTDELLSEAGVRKDEVTGIIGGPPCQGFSSIGKSHLSDPRNQLFKRFFEIVKDIKPAFFVCENVPGILRPQYDNVREEALNLVQGSYSILGPIKLRASDYGAPTTRTRAFFFGINRSLNVNPTIEMLLPSYSICPVSVKEALTGLPPKIRDEWQSEEQGWRKVRYKLGTPFQIHLSSKIPSGVGDQESIDKLNQKGHVSGCLGTVHQDEVINRFSAVEPGKSDKVSRAPRLSLDGFCPTLRAGTGSDRGSYQAVRPIHPTEPRVITPREAARLQGFPDWFRFAPSKWHSFRQIGNSVSPILSEHVLKAILSNLFDQRPPVQ